MTNVLLARVRTASFGAAGQSICRTRLDIARASRLTARGCPNRPPGSNRWLGCRWHRCDPARVGSSAAYPAAPGEVLLSGWVLRQSQAGWQAGGDRSRRGRGRGPGHLYGFRPQQYRGPVAGSHLPVHLERAADVASGASRQRYRARRHLAPEGVRRQAAPAAQRPARGRPSARAGAARRRLQRPPVCCDTVDWASGSCRGRSRQQVAPAAPRRQEAEG